MGCGASKDPNTVAAVSPGKEGKEEVPVPPQEATSKTADKPPIIDPKAPSVCKTSEPDTTPPVTFESHVTVAAKEPEATTDTQDGKQEDNQQAAQTVTVVDEPPAEVSPTPEVVPEERSSSSLRAQEPQDSPKSHARFEADTSAEEDAPRTALTAFKSSRSLNRSFGVRRRTSDAGSQEPPSGAPADEEAADAEPDPLREEFERMKAANPWLVGMTQKSAAVVSSRTSDKSLQASKRPNVGFALAGVEGTDTDHDDVDPEEHMEAERIASMVVLRDEQPAPVPRVQSHDGKAEPECKTRVEGAAGAAEVG